MISYRSTCTISYRASERVELELDETGEGRGHTQLSGTRHTHSRTVPFPFTGFFLAHLISLRLHLCSDLVNWLLLISSIPDARRYGAESARREAAQLRAGRTCRSGGSTITVHRLRGRVWSWRECRGRAAGTIL
jgi:hypothetical protein